MSNGYDPTDLSAQVRAQAVKSQRDQVSAENEDVDLKWLMGSKRGRRIAWRLLDRAGVFRLSFNTNSMTMAFNEGVKNEGLRLLGLIHAVCPELYPTMIREQINDRNLDDGQHNDH